jgi:hypothetical protein
MTKVKFIENSILLIRAILMLTIKKIKSQISTIGAAAVLISFGPTTLIGCGNDNHAHDDEVITAFYCSMKCEGDGTYSKTGSCPEFGIDLVELEY